MDVLPTPPSPIIKKSSKLPRMEYHTAPPTRVDPNEESEYREHIPTCPIQTTIPSAVTRGKYTKKLKELVKQRHRGHNTRKNMT